MRRPIRARGAALAVLIAVTAGGLTLVRALPVRAAGFVVNTTADASADPLHCTGSNTCTLRDAIGLANTAGGTNTITFSVAGPFNLTTAAGGELHLTGTQNLTITGNGSTDTVIDAGGSGGNAFRVLEVDATVTANISGITFRNGKSGVGSGIFNNGGTLTLTNSTVSGNAGSVGGGIFNETSGKVTLTNSTVSGNTGSLGGGIFEDNSGQLTLTNTTVSGNAATSLGGGFFIDRQGQLTLTNSTVSGNFASTGGGGFFLDRGASVTSRNSTIANNTAPAGSGISNSGGSTATLVNTILANNAAATNCSGAGITSSGHNLDTGISCTGLTMAGDKTNVGDARLGPLQGNGGPTQTQALLAGSPAQDMGDNAVCAAAPVSSVDQRGLPRFAVGDPTCDSGAFEAQPNPASAGGTVPTVGLPKAGGGQAPAPVRVGGGILGLAALVLISLSLLPRLGRRRHTAEQGS